VTATGDPDIASVNAVQGWIDTEIFPLTPECVPLDGASGRVIGVGCHTGTPIPDRDRAALDGFAVEAARSVGAAAYNPLSVPGSAVASGDPVPAGMDAVVPLDFAEANGHGGVMLVEAIAPGANVEPKGVVAAAGTVLVRAGIPLAPYHLGLLAAAGITELAVIRNPRIAIFRAGPRYGVPDSNGPMIRAAVRRDGGGMATFVETARDPQLLALSIAAAEADLALVIGGTGPGSEDHAAAALSQAGDVVFHGIALRPGETAGLGRTRDGIPVILLPGGPAACLWSYEMIAGRAIRRLAGLPPELPFERCTTVLDQKIVSAIGLTEICPVRFGASPDTVEPLPAFAEIGLAAAAGGDGFVIVPETSEGYPRGAAVTVHLYQANHRKSMAPR
jgi:molybdopterin molybdotransferase